MLHPTHWPDWFQTLRLFVAFAMTVGLGIHAYNAHVRESVEAVSPRRLMYWLYSAAFLFISIANFAQLAITTIYRSYDKASFHLGYATLLLALSYVALLAGVRRK